MKAVVFSSKRYEREFLTNNPEVTQTDPKIELEFTALRLDSTPVHLAAGADAFCAFVNDNINDETCSQLAKGGTRCILLQCAGFNQVDLPAATKNGITVLRVPAYSPYAVVEFAVALLLTTGRNTHKAYNGTRVCNFLLFGLVGFDVRGKTIGVCDREDWMPVCKNHAVVWDGLKLSRTKFTRAQRRRRWG